MPDAYPTEQAERVYRWLLEQLPEKSDASFLMGQGFTGAAYRYRSAESGGIKFEAAIETDGYAPSFEKRFKQEELLFNFFVSGIACIDSFAFATHMMATHFAPEKFSIDHRSLRGVNVAALSKNLNAEWSDKPLAIVWDKLFNDEVYKQWGLIRNVLAHRAVLPRAITIVPGAKSSGTWRLAELHGELDDEDLMEVTGARRAWLSKTARTLWAALEGSLPL